MRSAETGARVAEKGISVSPIPSPQTFPTFRQLRRNEISIDTGQLNPPRTNEPMCRASRRSPGTGHIQRCARGRDVHARRCRDIKRDSLFCRTRVEQGVYRLARGRGGRNSLSRFQRSSTSWHSAASGDHGTGAYSRSSTSVWGSSACLPHAIGNQGGIRLSARSALGPPARSSIRSVARNRRSKWDRFTKPDGGED